MPSDTLAEPAAAAEESALPRILPRRRPGQWAAALVALVLLGFACVSAAYAAEAVRAGRGAERTR
ncbi:hypothetical protein ACWD5Q_25710 [Streptomyces sp. NPDC002513]